MPITREEWVEAAWRQAQAQGTVLLTPAQAAWINQYNETRQASGLNAWQKFDAWEFAQKRKQKQLWWRFGGALLGAAAFAKVVPIVGIAFLVAAVIFMVQRLSIKAATIWDRPPNLEANKDSPLLPGQSVEQHPPKRVAQVPAPPTVAPPPKPTMPGQLSDEPKVNKGVLGVFIVLVLLAGFFITMILINEQSRKDSAPVLDLGQLSTTPAVSTPAVPLVHVFSTSDLGRLRYHVYVGDPGHGEIMIRVFNGSHYLLKDVIVSVTAPQSLVFNKHYQIACGDENALLGIQPGDTKMCSVTTNDNLYSDRGENGKPDTWSIHIIGAQGTEVLQDNQ